MHYERLGLEIINQALEDIKDYGSICTGKKKPGKNADEKARFALAAIVWLATPSSSDWVIRYFDPDFSGDALLRKKEEIGLIAQNLLKKQVEHFIASASTADALEIAISDYFKGKEGKILARYAGYAQTDIYGLADAAQAKLMYK